MSDREKTRELIGQLQAHYCEPGNSQAGGVFAPEVGINGGFGNGSRCDGIYAGFTSASGRILIGHEVKVSRADWRKELDTPGKADWWADQCHAWYLVAPSLDIIPKEEVPNGWGLIVPNPRAKRRMAVAVKADVHADRNPSWEAMRSFLARLDTLRAEEVKDIVSTRLQRDRAEMAKRYENRHSDDFEVQRLKRIVAQVEEHFGVTLRDWDNGDATDPETLAAALKLIRSARRRGRMSRGLLPNILRTAEDAVDNIKTLQTDLGDFYNQLEAEV